MRIHKCHFLLKQRNLPKTDFALHCSLKLLPQSLPWSFMKILYSYRTFYLICICGRQKANSTQKRRPQALSITDVQLGLVVLNWVGGSRANTSRDRIFATHVLLQICYMLGMKALLENVFLWIPNLCDHQDHPGGHHPHCRSSKLAYLRTRLYMLNMRSCVCPQCVCVCVCVCVCPHMSRRISQTCKSLLLNVSCARYSLFASQIHSHPSSTPQADS